MEDSAEPTAGVIVQAGVSMFCHIGTHVSGAMAPLLCGLLQAYEVVQAAVVVVTRRSWSAVGTLVRQGRQSERWTPSELEEFLANSAVLLGVLGFTWWMLKRSPPTRPIGQESPGSSSVEEAVELGGVTTPEWGPTALPDVSEYTPDDHLQAMKYRSFTNEALMGVCRARGVSASGRKAVLVDTLVRSEPGMRNHI